MNILLTNDDGIYNDGLWHAWSKLADKHDVTVVAPRTEQSGVAHAFTLHRPLGIDLIELDEERKGWCVEGTPSDCVKIAITKILKKKPDMVVAGINAGDNSGVSHFYSGTFGAAREAFLWNIPAIAVSISIVDKTQFKNAAEFLRRNIERLVDLSKKHPMLLNINFPPVAVEHIKGTRITRQGKTMFKDDYVHGKNPRGKDYYWIYGNKPESDFEKDSDDQAMVDGYISIAPLSIDATDYNIKSFLEKEL